MNTFPIPDFRAEEAAKDFAADIRALVNEKIFPLDNLNDPAQRKIYDEVMADVRAMSETVFVCDITKKEFRVKDYLTPQAEFRKLEREKAIASAYSRLSSWLH